MEILSRVESREALVQISKLIIWLVIQVLILILRLQQVPLALLLLLPLSSDNGNLSLGLGQLALNCIDLLLQRRDHSYAPVDGVPNAPVGLGRNGVRRLAALVDRKLLLNKTYVLASPTKGNLDLNQVILNSLHYF